MTSKACSDDFYEKFSMKMIFYCNKFENGGYTRVWLRTNYKQLTTIFQEEFKKQEQNLSDVISGNFEIAKKENKWKGRNWMI